MSSTRREFLTRTSAAALAVGLRGRLPPATVPMLASLPPVPSVGDPTFRAIALRAVDAARSAGASYADVRITHTREERINWSDASVQNYMIWKSLRRSEELGLGVRVLVDGAWGFVAERDVSDAAAVRCARAAVVQAKANAWGAVRDTRLAPAPPVLNGSWTTPILRDPFAIDLKEKTQYMQHLNAVALALPSVVHAESGVTSQRQEKTFASSDGSLFVQTTHSSDSHFRLDAMDPVSHSSWMAGSWVPSTGLGYEAFDGANLEARLPQFVDEAQKGWHRTESAATTIPVGRYDIVFDTYTMANILADSIGGATELDRALGYEANASGTSYLAPPTEMLGTFKLGPEILNIRADRSQPTSLARVAWDDDGAVPDECLLVKQGVIHDYQTTREQAPWLAEWYAAHGVPVRSHGYSASQSAFYTPMQHRPNISLLPGQEHIGFDELVASTKKGLAFTNGGLDHIDQQYLNWQLGAREIREIVNGKLGAVVRDARVRARAPEFWKSLLAIGGPKSYTLRGMTSSKGQPGQNTPYSIGCVPAKFRQATVINFAPTA